MISIYAADAAMLLPRYAIYLLLRDACYDYAMRLRRACHYITFRFFIFRFSSSPRAHFRRRFSDAAMIFSCHFAICCSAMLPLLPLLPLICHADAADAMRCYAARCRADVAMPCVVAVAGASELLPIDAADAALMRMRQKICLPRARRLRAIQRVTRPRCYAALIFTRRFLSAICRYAYDVCYVKECRSTVIRARGSSLILMPRAAGAILRACSAAMFCYSWRIQRAAHVV